MGLPLDVRSDAPTEVLTRKVVAAGLLTESLPSKVLNCVIAGALGCNRATLMEWAIAMECAWRWSSGIANANPVTSTAQPRRPGWHLRPALAATHAAHGLSAN